MYKCLPSIFSPFTKGTTSQMAYQNFTLHPCSNSISCWLFWAKESKACWNSQTQWIKYFTPCQKDHCFFLILQTCLYCSSLFNPKVYQSSVGSQKLYCHNVSISFTKHFLARDDNILWSKHKSPLDERLVINIYIFHSQFPFSIQVDSSKPFFHTKKKKNLRENRIFYQYPI